MKKTFAWVFIATLIAKIWFASELPITGDEAYFYWWGVYPAWGYYDHPPMVGWMIYLLRMIGEGPLILRTPTILITFIIAFGIVDLIRRLNPQQSQASWGAGALYMLLPISWIGVPVTTDTPLILFIFLSGYSFIRGELSEKARHSDSSRYFAFSWFALCGVFLGMAFLSKYFAVLIGIAYAIALVITAIRRHELTKNKIIQLIVIVVSSLPFLMVNLAYNVENCWNNVMFNGINRHEFAQWGWENLAIFTLMMFYLLTPWLTWSLWRQRSFYKSNSSLVVLFFVPLVLFFLISFKKTIGLHWVLGFLPFVMVFVGLQLPINSLIKQLQLTSLFSTLHLLALIWLIYAPTPLMPTTKLQDGFSFLRDAKFLPGMIMKDAPKDTVLMARAYTPASLFGFHFGKYLPVFGVGKFHARQDDVFIDFRVFEGKTIRVFDKTRPKESDFVQFFDSLQILKFSIADRDYWVLEGRGFHFDAYKDLILREIAEKYYRIPPFLPKQGCLFKSRYLFD